MEEIDPTVARAAVERWLALADIAIAEKSERLADMSPAADNFTLRYARMQGERDALREARAGLHQLLHDLQQPHKGE